jgi:hypothetical protein
MANHVSTQVMFRRINDAGKAKLAELIARIRPTEDGRHYQWFGDMWVDGKDGSPTYEETDQYVWTTENIGPKWCYFEDIGDDYFNTTSAWSWPQQGMEWLFDQIAEVDQEFLATVTYEDEMPNFYGAVVYDADGIVDMIDSDSDDIEYELEEKFPEMAGMKDEDDERTDEYWDLWNEHIWEHMSDVQWEFLSSVVDSILETKS